MKLTKLNDIKDKLLQGRHQYNPRGLYPGFESMFELFSLKKGFPLFIAGDAHSGKTEFALELLVSASELHGWKHFCYFGETGSDRDIFAELCSKYIGKPFYKNSRDDKYAMSDTEAEMAMLWVNEHFYLMPSNERFTIEEFYINCSNVENVYGITFDTTIIDPIGDCKGWEYNLEYLNQKYIIVRRSSAKNNRMDIIVNHVGETQKMQEKGGTRRHKLPAIPDEWAGGKANYRAGFQMLLYYRPADWMNDETGKPVEKNEAWVYCQKSKPKGVGKVGMNKIYWDWKRGRFYEKDTMGCDRYSGKEPKKEWYNPLTGRMQSFKPDTQSNINPDSWIESDKEDDDAPPF